MRYANGIHKETKQSREIDLQTEAESVIAEYDLFCPGCGAEAHFRHGAREEQADQRHDATEKTRKESNKKNHGYSDEHAPDCIIAKGTRIVRVYSDEYVDIDGMVAYRDKDRQGPTEGGQEPPCEPGEGKEPEKVIPDDGDERFDPHAERRITNVKQLFEALSNRRTDEAVDVGESITVGEFMMDRRTASGLRENFRGGVKMVVTKCCEEYLSYPGGYNQHHAMPGGLAAHSYSMAALADALAAQYGTELNANLLRAGCLLHDIGKIRIYTLASTGFSKGYRAKEHTEAGAKMVLEVGRSLHILESKLQMVVHLIRHHHEDKKDTDGTVQPSPPEVFALRKLDKMDSEMDSLLSTRRGIRDGEFTGYNRHLRRNISFAA